MYTQSRKELVNIVEVSELRLQDNFFLQIGDATEAAHKIFASVPAGQRAYEYDDSAHLTLAYELNSQLRTYEREAFTLLDWAGNLGGLSEGMKMLFGLLLGICNFNNIKLFFVSQLFHKRYDTSNDSSMSSSKRESLKSSARSKRESFAKKEATTVDRISNTIMDYFS